MMANIHSFLANSVIHEKLSLNPNFDMVVLYSFLMRHLSYVYHLKGNLPQVTMLYTTHMSLLHISLLYIILIKPYVKHSIMPIYRITLPAVGICQPRVIFPPFYCHVYNVTSLFVASRDLPRYPLLYHMSKRIHGACVVGSVFTTSHQSFWASRRHNHESTETHFV